MAVHILPHSVECSSNCPPGSSGLRDRWFQQHTRHCPGKFLKVMSPRALRASMKFKLGGDDTPDNRRTEAIPRIVVTSS